QVPDLNPGREGRSCPPSREAALGEAEPGQCLAQFPPDRLAIPRVGLSHMQGEAAASIERVRALKASNPRRRDRRKTRSIAASSRKANAGRRDTFQSQAAVGESPLITREGERCD